MFDLFSVSNGSQPMLAECWGRPFRIYATKQFPGLEPSTELTKVTNFIVVVIPLCSSLPAITKPSRVRAREGSKEEVHEDLQRLRRRFRPRREAPENPTTPTPIPTKTGSA